MFTAAEAVAAAAEGRDVILVRPFTDAEDVAGFHAAKGILTSEGGKASHAALVARGMGRPAVVGAQALADRSQGADGERRRARELHEGDAIAIDGTTGRVTVDDVPLVEAQVDENFEQVLGWADEIRRMSVRTNADTPEDATRARELGALGDRPVPHRAHVHGRGPPAQDAGDDHGRDLRGAPRRRSAELLPLQQDDFEGIFEAMAGLPVTVRLLDPPLHEFLPNAEDLAAQVERARIEESDDLPELERMLDRVHEIAEENPMLGTRGCRLGILYPEIYEMQVHAILRAAKAAAEEPPHPEIMIPLVDYEQELEHHARARRRASASRRG